MFIYFTSFFVLLFLNANVASAEGNEAPEIIQFLAISRHGARAPKRYIPTLPCDSFKVAFAELTETGQKQHYELGKQIRKDYPFIPKDYKQSDFYFRSSDEDRSLMSCENNLMGLFEDNFKKQLPFQSYPVHSESRDNDYIIQGRKSCKKEITKIEDEIMKGDTYRKKEEESKPLLKNLTEKGGFNFTLTIDTLSEVGDPLDCANAHGYKECMFKGEDEPLNDKALELDKWSNQIMHPKENSELAKMLISPFVEEVVSKIEAGMKKKSYQYLFYSGHDGNLLSLIQLFKKDSPGKVPYASIFYFEVYKINSAAKRPFKESDIGIKLGYRPFETTATTVKNVNEQLNNTNSKGKSIRANNAVTLKSEMAEKPKDGAWNRFGKAFKIDWEAVEAEEERRRNSNEMSNSESIQYSYTLADKATNDYTKDVCGKDYCTVSDLKKYFLTTAEWKKRCQINVEAEHEDKTAAYEAQLKKWKAVATVVSVILAVVCVSAVLVIVIMFIKKRRNSKRMEYENGKFRPLNS
ncbi:putative prostatic acid phosphatase precursor [Monocercomonoides exilis]|uniref:putative prostatic acid phosphatase precursor n=1 Tax=Monocercomonoides exilis TaxID=2049356 RepID=UPI00355A225F|nr:putative prostatic acid phosphatase precursor [Monocercomonoides exilis]|eukprot:MONOS_11005.1-p1 / transcript=MONOS_11005.1 / gene=MONOS_11005 / organism=Monocercomonoides_exilis_PA203 / gene_product=prostatic acid phosphatase precursor / transcript_product=prostatic acid phosphatase precursor / location=Mono_scaffold00527:31325-33492(+) / protein_length=522 / sequence_SO=supercontig / SO=protein_coding / is_pseudo=false